MGRDKAFVEVDGVPLWRRQLRVLEQLAPAEIFLAGPARPEWKDAGWTIIPDAEENSGPLAGLASALRRCSTPLLLALAVDLPNITSDYLHLLLALCTAQRGVVPRSERFEPLVALYPKASAEIATQLLASPDHSLQHFAARCIAAELAIEHRVAPADEPLFLNMNTPAELAAVDR